MRIYVGNLPYDVTGEELRERFAPFGKVESVNLITDRDTGRSKGFAFVEMPSVTEGEAAIKGLNGKPLKERMLTVSVARSRADDRGASQQGGRPGGYGGDRGRRF